MHASRRETVWWTKSNFLGLLPKTVEDQWDCEISNYYVALPNNIQIYSSMCFFLIGLSEYPCFSWRVFRKVFWMMLGYTVAKGPARPRNSTWFTRPFLLVRGCGLGSRLAQNLHFSKIYLLATWLIFFACAFGCKGLIMTFVAFTQYATLRDMTALYADVH